MSTTVALAGADSSVQPYVQNQAPTLHQAWANGPAIFDRDSGRYVPEVEACTVRFKKVMALYAAKTNNSVVKQFDILGCHTWEEVQETAGKAVEAYNAKQKGFKGILKRVGRAFGRASPAHQGWIQALPAGDYTSVVCGALTLIFGAAARMNEVQKKILDALDCLLNADNLEMPEAYLTLYQNDPNLTGKASELYIAILVATESMLDWLDHKAYKEVGKAIGMQGHYGKPIEVKLEQVQMKTAAFAKQVDVCLHFRIGETNYLAKVNDARTGEMLETINAAKESLTDYAKDNSKALNSLTAMLTSRFTDLIKYAEWHMKLAQELTARAAIQAPSPPIITIEQLILLLQVNPETVMRDSELAMRQGNMLSAPDQQRAAWLLSNAKFQAWFQSGHSETLVVDGSAEMARISPLSYFCAMLSQELGRITNAIPLCFFCGMRSVDSMSDASSIMRTLITRLIANPYVRQSVNLHFVSADAVMGLQSHRLDYLCELFRRLVLSLSSNSAVFCLIDGISWFENESRRDNLWFVMEKLRDLVSECNGSGATGGVVFKLLATSPKASMHVKHVFPRDRQLVMPAQTLGNGQTFNARQMAMQQQRLLGSGSSTNSAGSGRLPWMDNSVDVTPVRQGQLSVPNYDLFRRSDSSNSSP